MSTRRVFTARGNGSMLGGSLHKSDIILFVRTVLVKVEYLQDANAKMVTGLFLTNMNSAVSASSDPEHRHYCKGVSMFSKGLFFYACVDSKARGGW